MEWVIIKLRDRDETPLWEEDDPEDGFIEYGYETKKKAEERAKWLRKDDKFYRMLYALADATLPKRYRYIVEREDRI